MRSQACPWCGIANPIDANFCWNCAGPQRAYDSVPDAEWEWEVCKIEAHFPLLLTAQRESASDYMLAGWLRVRAGVREWTVVARARGPFGEYLAVSAPTVRGHPNLARDELARVLDDVARRLVEDGWERVGQFSTFQRRAVVRPSCLWQ